jgi:hypothetical protein
MNHPHLMTEKDPVSETLCFLDFRIPDDGQNPVNLIMLLLFKIHNS